jgi:hypothetical protein
MLTIYAFFLFVPRVSDFWARKLGVNMNILSIFLQTFTRKVSIYHYTPGYWVNWASGNMSRKLQENPFIFPRYVFTHSSIYSALRFDLNLLTYLLTPWNRLLLEKLTGSAASQEIPRILWN